MKSGSQIWLLRIIDQAKFNTQMEQPAFILNINVWKSQETNIKDINIIKKKKIWLYLIGIINFMSNRKR